MEENRNESGMTISEKQGNGYVTLAPEGDLDANSSMSMDEKIRGLIGKGVTHIHIDCRRLDYISSAGLGVFISFMDELNSAGGEFVFSGMSENIFKVFQLLGLDRLMKIEKTEEMAVKKFRA